jgi:glycylpeptide N-tetradecanoyltransferase
MPHGERIEHPEGPIVPDKPVSEIRQEPYAMPGGFEWSNVDVNNDDQRLELYQLLANNYVEDHDALFRFDYSHEFLLWALTPPGFRAEFLFGVRSTSSHKLVAFVSGVPARVNVYEREIKVVEVNFLCIHKKLRSKRLAPVLIKEITRRVNLTGVFQAVYTAGAVLPVPVASARYYHRSLNPKKLINVGFSRLGNRMTMARMQKLYKLPDAPLTPGLRLMEEKDVDAVHQLLTQYLTRFKLSIFFSKEEVAHWLLPRAKVIDSFVVESQHDGLVTDFVSFYHLPSSILHHDDTLYAAYSFYNVATVTPFEDLMKDALILAKISGADVFNCLNLMENQPIMEPLRFGIGDGNLQYYIYNWACPEMTPDKVGIVLL